MSGESHDRRGRPEAERASEDVQAHLFGEGDGAKNWTIHGGFPGCFLVGHDPFPSWMLHIFIYIYYIYLC